MRASSPLTKQRIEDASAGDKTALFRLYGEASAWLAAGKAPPEPLCSWLASRARQLCEAIQEGGGQKSIEAAALKAAQVRRASGTGRPRSRQAESKARGFVQDVQHFIDWHDLEPAQAMEACAALHKGRSGIDQTEQIKAAWKKRTTLFPVTSG